MRRSRISRRSVDSLGAIGFIACAVVASGATITIVKKVRFRLGFLFPVFAVVFASSVAMVAIAGRVPSLDVLYWPGLATCGALFLVATWLGRRLVERLEAVRATLGRFAQGDLSGRLPLVPRVDELDSIARSTNSVGEAMCALVTELRDASQALEREAGAFQGVFARIAGQSHRSREASGTVAAALEEMTTGFASIGNEAKHVESVAVQAVETSGRLDLLASETSETLSRNHRALESALQDVRKSLESTVELERIGQGIAGMALSITDVSKKTRLLALNASIEAERAGERGRGFAVVAQEVKDLAHQSAGMAERIQKQVEEVERGISAVSGDMTRMAASLEALRLEGNAAIEASARQGEMSARMRSELDASSRNLSSIARTIDESRAALEEINRSTHELDSRARATAAAIDGAKGGVDELGRFARTFQGTVKEMAVRPEFFPWTPDLAVGVPTMDDQHKVLLRLINRLADLTESGGGGASIRIVLGQLVDYTRFHFKDEEALMQRHGFPGIEAHRKIHAGFVAEVERLASTVGGGSQVDAASLLPVLKEWLVEHIQGTDKVYGAHVGAKLDPESARV